MNAEQLVLDASAAPDIDAVVKDMLARREAHTMSARYGGPQYSRISQATCSCGWEASKPTHDLRPQWAEIDAHLLPTLPDWERGVCWCGRAILLNPFGIWIHVGDNFMGHRAGRPREGGREQVA